MEKRKRIGLRFLAMAFCLLTHVTIAEKAVNQPLPAETASPLTGVWQICRSAQNQPDGRVKLVTGNALKILSHNGTFTNISFNCTGGESVITAHGTYRQTSDSTYVEQVTVSVNSFLKDKESNLIFYIVNDKVLKVKFFVEKNDDGTLLNRWFEELWLKVEPVKR